MAQASSYFKHQNTHVPHPLLELLHLVTYLQLLKMTIYVKATTYTVIPYSYYSRLFSMTHFNSKTMPILTILTTVAHRSCRACLTNHIESITHYTMPLVIISLESRHTHIYTTSMERIAGLNIHGFSPM